ncbi:NUDIX hydrolase domain-like protein [Neurospora hispaniola]|uniref:NUDIX hydrolase domain-like protein n=1 Tax=Neurospora hispaniola TaxID=588809 RepID=A0AAJ0IDJ7_9PEZI|nr:NUDIX hydrolase domain-like protein [Neurospora hispaniola]
MSQGKARVISTELLPNSEAEWKRLVKTTYIGQDGVTRTWEHAERTTRPEGSAFDGVSVVAILEKDTGREILLEKQYRPPLDKICIELPAGLVDKGETAEQAAVRELKEETGYVAQALTTSPIMFNDPGFCNTNFKLVEVSVDMSLPENQNLKPELEENEFIEVFHVKLDDLWDECVRWEAQGYALDARLASFAKGIQIAQKFGLVSRP